VTELESFYQEILREHYSSPRHAGLREPFDAQAQAHHVTRSDVSPLSRSYDSYEVAVRVTLSDAGSEPVLADVSYQVTGNLTSQASASVMADLIIGKTVGEAMDIYEAFRKLMLSQGNTEPDEDRLGDAVAFAPFSKYPSRITSVLLPWRAWKDATERALGQLDETAPAANRPAGAREL
jgi:nitrogen fixation protein NifU and related proteins